MYSIPKRPLMRQAKSVIETSKISASEENGNIRSKKLSQQIAEQGITGTVDQSDSKPVFRPVNLRPTRKSKQADKISPEHEELVKFVSEGWKQLEEKKSGVTDSSKSTATVRHYRSTNINISDFEPFDLEAWWGRRLLENIEKSAI
ncbi:MAPK regulated corepressor interacting protein 2-like isoform X1 [Artemia franciscana]|uniref:Uncharacterized protein n=1 Tax=Artemia franciscana TaxID=6661 RepID=A0AA88L382_ARTSF|nr:hypothetical protein QYM36_016251 [Artemia franciscana]